MKNSKKKRDHKKEIIQALYKLIIEKGYDNISIRDIRDKANVAMGTIYHHFSEGKPAIMKDLIIYFATEVLGTDRALSSDMILNPDYLQSFIANLVKTTREHHSYYAALTQAILSEADFFKDINEITKNYYKSIVKKLRKNYESFKQISEEDLLKCFILISHTCSAYIFQHMFIDPLFESDGELIKFLTKLIGYFIKTDFDILS